jgi:hypothetical protein
MVIAIKLPDHWPLATFVKRTRMRKSPELRLEPSLLSFVGGLTR